MPNDPFAVQHALTELTAFVEQLATELRRRRAPLENGLDRLLLTWDTKLGHAEIAVQLLAVGSAVRKAGLADAVERWRSRTYMGSTDPCAILLNVALMGTASHINALLANLDNHPERRFYARVSLRQYAEQLLVVWCELHATDYPARFHAELKRLNLERCRVETWFNDEAPHMTDAAKTVLWNLLDGGPFEVGWLTPPICYNDAIMPDPVPPQRDTVPVDDASTRTVENPTPPQPAAVSKPDDGPCPDRTRAPIPNEEKPDPFDDLRAAAESLMGNEKKLVLLLCDNCGRVPLQEVALACEWETNRTADITVYVNAWNSLKNRLNGKFKKRGWWFRQHHLCAVVERTRLVRD